MQIKTVLRLAFWVLSAGLTACSGTSVPLATPQHESADDREQAPAHADAADAHDHADDDDDHSQLHLSGRRN